MHQVKQIGHYQSCMEAPSIDLRKTQVPMQATPWVKIQVSKHSKPSWISKVKELKLNIDREPKR